MQLLMEPEGRIPDCEKAADMVRQIFAVTMVEYGLYLTSRLAMLMYSKAAENERKEQPPALNVRDPKPKDRQSKMYL